jgi:precorrin-8X/cobalt-precorrin-8 methylmutase
VSVPCFDRYVMVDWSAASVPSRGKDSIWVAVLDTGREEVRLVNPATRTEARDLILEVLVDAVDTGRRVLVGIDVPFGYPAGAAEAIGGPVGARAWRWTWDHLAALVHDDVDGRPNRNDRFAVAARLNRRIGGDGVGPFWGRPPSVDEPSLSTHKPPFPFGTAAGTSLAEFRHTEHALRHAGLRPFSVWQTSYAGSVGGQALTAFGVLRSLRDDPRLVGVSAVWPFETDFTSAPTSAAGIVLAEVWPSAVSVPPAGPQAHPVRDARQVTALCRWAAALDAEGRLGPLFAPDISPDVARAAIDEEGWVLWDPR